MKTFPELEVESEILGVTGVPVMIEEKLVQQTVHLKQAITINFDGVAFNA